MGNQEEEGGDNVQKVMWVHPGDDSDDDDVHDVHDGAHDAWHDDNNEIK
jgi:hypothetical protein